MSFLQETTDLSFIIFYGSQLGQAKSIAEGLAETAEGEFGFKARAVELNVVKDVKDLAKLTCPIVIVTSTTGDGEPPENADKFWRKIRRKLLASDTLSSVKYTVLGLGDTNYNSFCYCGKEFNRRFQDLGAATFYDPAWADDAVGLESTVDDWIENLWPALESLIIRPGGENSSIPKTMMEKDNNKTALTVPALPAISLNLEWLEEEADSSKKHHHRISANDLINPLAAYPLTDGEPVEVTLKSARALTKPGAVKTALEVQFEFVGKPFDFEPGDAIGVVCPNSDDEIDKIFERLGVAEFSDRTLQLSVKEGSAKGKIPVHIPATIVLRDLFRYYLDVRSCPRKNFLRLLAEHTPNNNSSEKSELLHLSSRQGSPDFESKIRSPGLSLLDLLLTYPSTSPPLEALIEHLPRLSPRPYSVSSSPLVDSKSFSFVFNVVVLPEGGGSGRKYDRFGVCTGWLAGMARGKMISLNGDDSEIDTINNAMSDLKISNNNDPIVVYKRKNQHFRLPSDDSAPIVMVGPGTGVAPFVGFIRHRDRLIEEDESRKFGSMSLYFGCRHKMKDFLYEEELKSFRCLSGFYPVFSRDHDGGDGGGGGDSCSKVRYVQHRMEQNKTELVQTLLDDGGYLYVCGDARNMAKDVRETLVRIVGDVRGVGEEEAKKLVGDVTVGKRYLQDIWS